VASFELLSKHLLIMLLRFDKMLYSNVDNENSGESDIKCSRGLHYPGAAGSQLLT